MVGDGEGGGDGLCLGWMGGLAAQRDAVSVEYKNKECLMIATLAVTRFLQRMLCALRFLGTALDEVRVHEGISIKMSSIVGWMLSLLPLCAYETRCAPTLLPSTWSVCRLTPIMKHR